MDIVKKITHSQAFCCNNIVEIRKYVGLEDSDLKIIIEGENYPKFWDVRIRIGVCKICGKVFFRSYKENKDKSKKYGVV